MRKKLILFWAFLKRQYVYFRRYLFNSLGGMLTLYVVFLLILGGYKGLVAPAGTEGDTLEALVVGYVLWFFLMTTTRTCTTPSAMNPSPVHWSSCICPPTVLAG